MLRSREAFEMSPRRRDDNYRGGVKRDRHRRRPLSVRLDDDLDERVSAYAARTGESIPDLMRTALREFLAAHEGDVSGESDSTQPVGPEGS